MGLEGKKPKWGQRLAKAEGQSVWIRKKAVQKKVSKTTFLGVSEMEEITLLGRGI